MICVEIYISQEKNDHRFIIDGETVSKNSPMTGFVHKSFDFWKEMLINELVEECNRDYFVLKISANIEQFNYILNHANECEFCVKCINISEKKSNSNTLLSHKVDSIDEQNVWENLDSLFNTYGNKLSKTRKINLGFLVPNQYTNDYVEIIESLVKCGFSRTSMNFRRAYFNFSLEEIGEDDIEYFENEIVAYKFDKGQFNNIFNITTHANLVGKEIITYLANHYVSPFLNEMKSRDEKLVEKNELQIYLEDVNDFSITVPEIIDKGQTVQVKINGDSKHIALSKLQCVIDNPNILSYENGYVTAIDAGQTTIRFKVVGKLEYISKHQIAVVEHVFVNRIELNETIINGLVNEMFKISATCYPRGAENIDELKFESLTPDIIEIDNNGEIKTLANGFGIVRAYVGAVEAIATINVESRINEIQISKNHVHLYLGQSEEVNIVVVPSLYNENDINIKSQNEIIAIYKDGKVVAKGIGETEIIFSSKNSKIISKLPVKVESTFKKRTYAEVPVQIGIILIIIAIICVYLLGEFTYGLWVSIAALVLLIVSLIVDKRNRSFSFIFIILNAVVLYLLLR